MIWRVDSPVAGVITFLVRQVPRNGILGKLTHYPPRTHFRMARLFHDSRVGAGGGFSWHSHSWLCGERSCREARCPCEASSGCATELSAVTYYERNLPHWHPPAASIFLTWRLYGSLPKPLAPQGPKSSAGETFSQRFRRMDAVLDRAVNGPVWLTDGVVAECATVVIERGAGELRHYRLHAFVVMANHVHLLMTPLRPLSRITNALKGASARECNKILKRTGNHFWQDESFDHWVRTPNEFEKIRRYIEQNPVAAGLANAPADWPWSSAFRRIALS